MRTTTTTTTMRTTTTTTTTMTTLCALAFFCALWRPEGTAVGTSIDLSGAGTVREIFNRPPPTTSAAANVYNMMYCYNKPCPKWKCQDDSAIIHGYCCSCPNSKGDNVPVFCADDLKCPLRMQNLCNDYHFMMTCCCSGYW